MGEKIMKKKLKILFVEDIKHDYIAMNRALDKSELDCKILWVKQGKDAIQHLCSASFDIVLIDYKLPDENGLELLKEIKKNKLNVPVVFVAASGNESIAAEAIKLGAQDYIVKDPLGRYLEIIPDVIKKALTQWKIEQKQKISAEKLKRSEERYRAFIQSSSEGIWCFESAEPIPIDLDEDEIIEQIYATGTLVECNNMMAQMYGFKKREDIIGTKLENLLVPTDKRNIEYLKNFIHSDFRLIDGESHEPDIKGIIHVYLNNLIGIIENGSLIRCWGTQRDITLLKNIEKSLKQELRNRKILQDVVLSLLEPDFKKAILIALKAIRIGLNLPRVVFRAKVDSKKDWQISDERENFPGIESLIPITKRGEDTKATYEKKEISVVNDVREKYWYEKYKEKWQKAKLIAYLIIPCINSNGNINGVLYLHDDKVHNWSQDDINIGKAVATEFSAVVERKQIEEALKKKNEELEAFNKLAIGRELRMIELKKEVNELLEKLGKEAKYKVVE